MNLLVLTGIFPPNVGGPATYVPRISSELQQAGWNIEVLTAGKETASRSFPYPVHRISSSKLYRFRESQTFFQKRKNWADCIYVNGLEIDHYLAGSPGPSVEKIVGDRSWERYRNNEKGSLEIKEFQHRAPWILPRLEQKLQYRITQSNDRIIVPSNFLKNIVRQWGINEEKIHVIYNTDHPPQTIPDETIPWPGELKLLTVGRLVNWKRVPGLIRLMSDIRDAGLIVLGDGPEYQHCVEAIRKNDLAEQIELKGNVPTDIVWQHLQQADGFVLNSTYEGFPHVLLEAMATGTPAYAADSGGSKELAEFFPEYIRIYDREHPKQLIHMLKNDFPEDHFPPPTFPKKLQWDYIVDQTITTLKTAVHRSK